MNSKWKRRVVMAKGGVSLLCYVLAIVCIFVGILTGTGTLFEQDVASGGFTLAMGLLSHHVAEDLADDLHKYVEKYVDPPTGGR